MDLKKFLPGKGGGKQVEYYWALSIEPSWVQAAIWKIDENQEEVVFKGSPTAWELEEELITAIDTALSSAVQNFPQDAKEPSKTVFGVVSSWVTGGQIKEEYLEKIKKVCSELSLEPLGFVVLPEAIAHLVKSEEGSPASAILLGAYKESLEISVFRLGNLIGSTKVARSVSVIEDVAEGLTRFAGSVDPVPSRFIIYNGKEGELEEVRQSLLKVNWEDFSQIKFLHTPKIEVINVERKINAVALAGAQELTGAKISTAAVKQTEKEGTPEEKIPSIEKESEVQPEKLGFAIEKDVAAPEREEEQQQEFSQEEMDQSINNLQEPQQVSQKKRGLNLKNYFGKVGGVFSTITQKFASFKNFVSSGNKIFVFGFGFLIVALLAGLAWWWYYPKAEVTVYVSSKILHERISLTVDPDAESSDFSEKILKAGLVETEVNGEKTSQTTGTKTVGEKAKGEVTIYRVGSSITLDAGTAINGPDSLKFVLDDTTNVASGSASTPGSTKAKVTAEDIGSQYNLASNTNFTVANYSVSDLEAKNESSFSGGSSQEIRVVSTADQEDLEKDLENELKEEATLELKENLAEGKLFVDDSLVATPSSRKFNYKVGDEATSLKLDLSIKATALSVDLEEMSQFSLELLKDKVPEGFILRADQTKVDFEFEEERGDLYVFESDIEANLLPEVNAEEVKKAIRGRYPDLAKEYLTKEVPSFVRAEIKLMPKLPARLSTLPKVEKNIEVIISAEK